MFVPTLDYRRALIITKEKDTTTVSHSSLKTGGWEAILEIIHPATLRITAVCCIDDSSAFSAIRSIQYSAIL